MQGPGSIFEEVHFKNLHPFLLAYIIPAGLGLSPSRTYPKRGVELIGLFYQLYLPDRPKSRRGFAPLASGHSPQPLPHTPKQGGRKNIFFERTVITWL